MNEVLKSQLIVLARKRQHMQDYTCNVNIHGYIDIVVSQNILFLSLLQAFSTVFSEII